MGDWTLESEQDDPIQVTLSDGRTITLNRGDRFSTPSACEMLDFLQHRDPDIPLREGTNGWLDTLLSACRADGCVGSNGEINVAPIPGTASTPPPTPPAPEGDSASGQGAPAVPPGVRLRDAGSDAPAHATPPGTSSRPPEEEPRDHPTGEPDPTYSRPEPQQRVLGADPIDLFTGAFTLTETDLTLTTAALTLELSRTYRSGRAYYGPLGWGWDHNHNTYLRELADGSVAHWTGRLQENRFFPRGGDFESPPGVFDVLARLSGPDTRYVMTAAGGDVREYAQPAGWPHAERFPLVELRDRHGNHLTYTYDAAGHLVEVRDDDDRFLRFAYGQCGLLERVDDHAGRAILYEHAIDIEHLVAVRDADGAVRREYAYDDPWLDEQFRHNIVAVTGGDGDTFVENEYEQDPSAWGWGRVVAQRYGDFLYQVRYTQLQRTPIDPLFMNIPSVQVEVMDPEHSVTTSTFNGRGDLLDYRFRLVRDGSFRVVVHQFEYDAQGNRTLIRYPDGMEEHRTYDDADADPRMRGSLLQREVRARVAFPAPSRILWRGTYDPVFQLPRTVTDEAGNTTTYRYDHDAAVPGATGRLRAIELPDATLPDGTVQASTVAFESNARGQVTAVVAAEGVRTEFHYGATGNERGLLARIQRDVGGLDLTERFTHDAVGNIVTIDDDAGGGVREFAYDMRRNVIGAISAEVNGARATVALTRDSEGNVIAFARPRGEYTDAVLGLDPIRDVVTYNVLGHPITTTLAANTALPRAIRRCVDFRGQATEVIDANGMRIVQRFDERGMLLSKEAQGPDGTRLRERHVYDVAGRRIQHPTGPMADVLVLYEYDAFGRVHHITSSNGSVVTYTWGDDDLLSEEAVVGDPGNGVPRLLRRTRYHYDERGRLIRETHAAFRDDPAVAVDLTTESTYDGDNNRVAVTDARGATTKYRHDALGRLAETIDPVGNRVVRTYKGLDRLATVEHRDVDPNGTIVRTWVHEHDARGRTVRTTDPLGNDTTTEYDDRDVAVRVTNPNGIVEARRVGPVGELLEVTRDAASLALRHAWTYDAALRLLEYVDPMGEVTRYTNDGVGRRVAVTRPGFSSARTFGTDGRLQTERLASGAEIHFGYGAGGRLHTIEGVGAAGVSPVALAQFEYDGLDRLVAASMDGIAIHRSHDSFGRLTAESRDGVALEATYDDVAGTVERCWPDGRRELIAHDLSGFPIAVERIAAGALGNDGAALATFAPSGPARIASVTLQTMLTATSHYDTAGRLTRLAYDAPGGEVETLDYRYDRASRRGFEQATARNYARIWSFDDAGRVVATAEGFAPPLAGPPPVDQADHDADMAAATAGGASAPLREQLTYNEGDERRQRTRTGSPVTPYTYLAGHRVATAGAEAITYHLDGIRAHDAARTVRVDALGRVIRIDDAAGAATLLTLTYDALGRPAAITADGVTTRFFHFGDELLMETEDGAASRQYSAHPLGGAPLAVHLPGATLLPLADLSGSRIGYCDPAGQLIEAYAYEPFGTPAVLSPDGAVLATSAIAMEPVFAGLRWLPSAGLYLSRARLYDPRTGVFLSPDPYGAADSCNPYAYARHNPADYVDPTGELAFLAVLGIIAVGAVVGGALNAVRQGIALAEGAQDEFSWSELGLSTAAGAVLAPVVVFAPEVVIPLAGLGVASGAGEISRGHYATGVFDIGTSLFGLRAAGRSPSWGAGLSGRSTNAKLVIARTDLSLTELMLHRQRARTTNVETRAGLQRSIGDVRIARSVLDDPTIRVHTLDPRTKTVSERPLEFDPSTLGWDEVRRDVDFFRPDGTKAGDLDLPFPRFDIEIKLGAKAKGTAGKVTARNTYWAERTSMPYYLASQVPPDIIAKWQANAREIPLDIRTAARNGFDGHIQVTPEMRGGTPYFLRDLLSPQSFRYVFPSVGTGRK